MKRNLYLATLLIFTTLNSQAQKDIYIQEAAQDFSEVQKIMKPLTLNTVLEQGMRKNFDENIRLNSVEIFKNNLKDTENKFYYPNLDLVLKTESQRIGTLKAGTKDEGRNPKAPSGSFGLEFSDFTVFNWGKDYLSFLNDKETIERQIDQQKENSREFRQDLIANYFKLIYLKDLVKIKKEQLRNASFIYRMNREKLTLKKISKHDYYQARAEYLRSQQEYFETKLNFETASEELAALIDDPPGTQYIINEEFKYTKVKVSKKNALAIAYQKAPIISDAKLNKNNAIRDYEVALKDNLPLPKVTLNLGSYKHNFTGSSSKTLYETETDSNNIELVASVSATWNIFGDGGLFNKRKLANSRIAKETSNWNYKSARRFVEQKVINIFQNIENYQDRIKILEARVPSLKKRLDLALDRYLERKSRYNDFHLALEELFEAEEQQATVKYLYFLQKIELAQLIGIEDLPGESFDSLVNTAVAK